MRIVFALLISAMLAACATTGENVPRNAKVAPISIVGNQVDFRVVGTTIFGNHQKLIDVHEWNIDEHIEATTSLLLANAGFGIVKSVPESKSNIGKMSFLNFTSTYSFVGGKEGVRGAALAAGADYLLIVAKAPNAFSDPFFKTNQYITGYGVYQRSFFGEQTSITFAQLAVLLVDGRTGEVIADRIASESRPRTDSLWIDIEHATPDAANLSETRKDVMPLIDAVVRKALARMKLVDVAESR